MEKIPMLKCLIDLTKPVDELVEVITAVLRAHPHNAKEVIEALDMRVAELRTGLDEVDN